MSSKAERDFRGTQQFSLLRRLGEGSFGIVYEAFDRKRNSIVALKTLSRGDAASITRFKREFRTLADITHPNLVMLYELLSDGDEWFFTMELVNGVHMLRYVREDNFAAGSSEANASSRSSPSTSHNLDLVDTPTLYKDGSSPWFPEQTVVLRPPAVKYDRLRDGFVQLCEGISALHQSGLLHRDIKPSNVMVTSEGRVVLLDFGLVAEIGPEDTSATANIVGTPAYMSPEQAEGQPITQSSDWYSFGVMLYEALTGRLPFTGNTIRTLLANKRIDPPPPTTLVPGIPSDLSDLCRDLLRSDPRVRPNSADITTRLGGLQTQARTQLPVRSREGRILFGRDQHLRMLHEAYQGMRHGQPVTVHVSGLSGMGKTALVKRFLDDIEGRDKNAVVLSGRCYERESVPYKAVDSLIDSLAQYLKTLPEVEAARLVPRNILPLARLFPVLRDVRAVNSARQRVTDVPDSQELRRRAFGALRELFGRIGDEKPLILYIDDLQWGDLDSGALLDELVRAPDAPTMLLLVSYRSEEVGASPLLQRLISSRNRAGSGIEARELFVGELTSEEAYAAALALIGNREAGSLERATVIARESTGCPFFVNELARYHREKPAGSAPTLDEVIRQRVTQLPQQARHVLEAVAVAGQPIDRLVAREAAGLEGDENAAIGLLRSGHLVRVLGSGQMETYHDRIRESVAASLAPDVVRELHHRLAWAWEAVNADAETLAVHFHAAGENERAAHYAAIAASRAAEALAFDRAARFYRMALDQRNEQSPVAGNLRAALGDALANAGRGAEAAQAYQLAAKYVDSALAIDLERRAAEQLLFAGHINDGRAAARAVLARVGMRMPVTPRRALLSLLYHRVLLRLRGLKFQEKPAGQVSPHELLRIDTCRSLALVLGVYDVIAGTDFHSRHLLLALRAGEPYRVARALAPEVAYSALSGARSRVRTAKLEAKLDDLVRRIQNTHAIGLAQLYKGVVAFLEQRFHDGCQFLEAAESVFREKCTGAICELDTSVIFWTFCMINLGEWVKLSRRVPVLLKEAEERGDLYAAVAMRARILYLLYLVADDAEAARRLERDVHSDLPLHGFESPHYWIWLARVETALYLGEGNDAWSEVERVWPAFAGSLLTRVQEVYIESHHLRARCALAVGRLDEAARELRIIERESSAWGNAVACLIRASLAAARGDRIQALEAAKVAQQAFETLSINHYSAAIQRRRGELLGGDAGQALIEAADALMAAQNVQRPERMTAMLVPGRWTD
jgi:serine/threonine protein kinase